MSYNPENYKKVQDEYRDKQLLAVRAAEERADRVRLEIPELRETDDEMGKTGLAIYGAYTRFRGEALQAEIDRLKERNAALRKRREELLVSHGYPADYLKPRFECGLCRDTGAIGFRMCVCMKKKLVRLAYESSGIGHLIETKTFDSFDPACQSADPRAAEAARLALRTVRDFAETFGERQSRNNLLMIGGTGLGKTHLSAALAGRVIERGYDVVCVTAADLFGEFEHERFDRARNSDAPFATRRFYDAELLIVDDLGTEMTNQFTSSVFYNLLNDRLNRGNATVINTNLDPKDLKARYDDRIFSRIFGEFVTVPLIGTDVRRMKLGGTRA